MTGSLADRLALVTGASRGIGRAVALEFAREGAHVIALARTVGALEELDDEIRGAGGSTTLVPVDLRDFPALDRLGATIFERWGRLDILVANAGLLGPLSPLAHVDPPAFEDVIGVNVTANWRLVRSLDPLLRQSAAGRVIFLSSRAADRCEAYLGPYSISKAAVDALARTYAAETATTNVKVTIVKPGPLRTRMRAALRPGEDPLALRTPEEFAPRLVPLASADWTETGIVYDFPSDSLVRPQAMG